MLYLQLRRCLLERQLRCETKDMMTLAGLALQAEFGDFNVEVRMVAFCSLVLRDQTDLLKHSDGVSRVSTLLSIMFHTTILFSLMNYCCLTVSKLIGW